MAKIMVTGAAGFLGSFLTERLLREGYQVIGIDNLFRGKEENIKHLLRNGNFTFHNYDVRRKIPKKWFSGVEAIFHYAAVNGTLHFYEHPLEVLKINVEGTINILKAAVKNDIGTFIFSSSSEIYGDPENQPINEEQPMVLESVWNPRDTYAASKAIGEFYTRWFAAKSGMNFLILRFFNVYGPRMDSSDYGQVIPEFIRKALKEPKFTIISPGTQTRSFCYIDDHTETVLRIFEKTENEIFNVGNDEEVKIIDLGRLIHEALGKKFEYSMLPPRRGDPMRRVPDIKKVVSAVGYRPKTTLRKGLEKTIQWYRKKWGLIDG